MTRPPRIVLEASSLAQGAFGIGAYVRGLLDGLHRLRGTGELRADFTVLYLNPRGPVPPPPGPGFENRVLRLPRRALHRLWVRARILPLDWLCPGDLFHATAHVAPWTRCPAWVTMHDVSWRACPDSFAPERRAFDEAFCGPGLEHCLRSGGGIAAVSRFTAGEVERHYGIPAERIDAIHLAAPLALRPPSPEDRARIRARFSLGDRPYLLSLGLLERRKNLAATLRAWEGVRAQGLDAALVLAGQDGVGADEIRSLAAASPWSRDVVFPGRVPAADIPALYAEAAATVFLSNYEGFGLPVLESMALGTPVLVSDRGALPEVWGDPPSDSPRLVAPLEEPGRAVDLLASLLREPDLRRRCAEHGLRRAADFSWNDHARRLCAAWSRSLGHSLLEGTP